MKTKKILNYITLFIAFILIFGLVLACGEVETTPEKVEELTEEEMIIEEDTKADLEETYLSESMLISSLLTNSLEKSGQSFSDVAEGKISLAENKAITKEYIEEVKAYYDMYLALKPSKRLEKSHYLFGEAMDHILKSTKFLQSYIDTDDMEKMIGYLDQAIIEMALFTEYLLEATEQVRKLIE